MNKKSRPIRAGFFYARLLEREGDGSPEVLAAERRKKRPTVRPVFFHFKQDQAAAILRALASILLRNTSMVTARMITAPMTMY